MNRFKKPGFLKAFERANEKDTSTLLNSSDEDFFHDDLEPGQEDQSDHFEAASSSTKETFASLSNLKADTAVNGIPVAHHDAIVDSVEMSPRSPLRNSFQPKRSVRPMMRKATSERLDMKSINEDDNAFSKTTKLFRHESSHVATKSLFHTSVQEDESDSRQEEDDDDKFNDSFCIQESVALEAFDNNADSAKDNESESSDSSCGLSRAPETKQQIAASSSLKTTAGMIPDLIHPKGLNAAIDRKDTNKKGLSRLITRTKKKEKPVAVEQKDDDLEATMVRVDCGDGTETFAQFKLGVRGEDSPMTTILQSQTSEDSSSESAIDDSECNGNNEKEAQRISAATGESIDHKRNDKKVSDDRKGEGRKASTAKTRKPSKSEPSASSHHAFDSLDISECTSIRDRQPASREVASNEDGSVSSEIQEKAPAQLDNSIISGATGSIESSPSRKKSTLGRTSHSAPNSELFSDPQMDGSRRSIDSKQDNKLLDASERRRNKTIRSEHLRSSRRKNSVTDPQTERLRATQTPDASTKKKVAHFEEFSWQRSPSQKAGKKSEQDINSLKIQSLKADHKSSKIGINDTRSSHPPTPKTTKSSVLSKSSQDEEAVNSSVSRKPSKLVQQKSRRLIGGSSHGARDQDKSEVSTNDVLATDSPAILTSTEVQQMDLKHSKPTRQRSSENKAKNEASTRKKQNLKADTNVESDAESVSSRESVKKTVSSVDDRWKVEISEKPSALRRQSSASNMSDLLKLNDLMNSKPPLKRAGSDGTLNCSSTSTLEPIPMHDWFKKQHEALVNGHNNKVANKGESKSDWKAGTADPAKTNTTSDKVVINTSPPRMEEKVSPHSPLRYKTSSARNLLSSPAKDGGKEKVTAKYSRSKSTRHFTTEANSGESSNSDRHRRDRDRDRDANSKRKSKSSDQNQDGKVLSNDLQTSPKPDSSVIRRHKSSGSQSKGKSSSMAPETPESRKSGSSNLTVDMKTKSPLPTAPFRNFSDSDAQTSSRIAGDSENSKNRVSLASFLTFDDPSQGDFTRSDIHLDESNMLSFAETAKDSVEDTTESAEAEVTLTEARLESSRSAKIKPNNGGAIVTEQIGDKQHTNGGSENETTITILDSRSIKARKNLWHTSTPLQNRSRKRSTANIRFPVLPENDDIHEEESDQEEIDDHPNDAQQKQDYQCLPSDSIAPAKYLGGAAAIRKIAEDLLPQASKHSLKVKLDSVVSDRGNSPIRKDVNEDLAIMKEKNHLLSAELECSKRTIEEMSKKIARLEREVASLRHQLGEGGNEL